MHRNLPPLSFKPPDNQVKSLFGTGDPLEHTKESIRLPGIDYDVDSNCLAKLTNFSSVLGRGCYAVVQSIVLPPKKHEFDKYYSGRGSGLYPSASWKTYAVKSVGFKSEAYDIESIRREIEIAEYASECIFAVKVFGCIGTWQTVHFFMEVLDSNCDMYYKDLKALNRKLSEMEIQHIGYAVASCLQFLKRNRYMHRDVKPSNILLSESGHVRLSDFGIARQLPETPRCKMTHIYSRSYLPPERIQYVREYSLKNKGDYDPKADDYTTYDYSSDVWCLGVTLIELARQSHPYLQNKDLDENFLEWEIWNQLAKEGPKLPENQGWSESFRTFVDSCVHPDPNSRPSYDQLISDFEFLSIFKGVDPSTMCCAEIAENLQFLRCKEDSELDEL